MGEGGRRPGEGKFGTIEIAGLDIYDPTKDEVKSRDVHEIAYWMVDDDHDGSNFVVRQVFFCGGDKDELEEWKKGLSNRAAAAAKKKVEQTLKLQIDDQAFARIYGHKSHPFPVKHGQRIAVRVISQFGGDSHPRAAGDGRFEGVASAARKSFGNEVEDLRGLVLQTQTSMREMERLIEAMQNYESKSL
jgi:hypothetical protein